MFSWFSKRVLYFNFETNPSSGFRFSSKASLFLINFSNPSKNLSLKIILGSIGYKRYEVNAYGKRIREISIGQGQSGKTFKTTLDLEIQKLSTKLLKDKAGSICVMDIYKGDIVIMASSPTFDPNKFVHGINQKDWNQLIQHRDKPLVNKAISGLYPPGSTIKTLVTISALENDVVNPKMVLQCV